MRNASAAVADGATDAGTKAENLDKRSTTGRFLRFVFFPKQYKNCAAVTARDGHAVCASSARPNKS